MRRSSSARPTAVPVCIMFKKHLNQDNVIGLTTQLKKLKSLSSKLSKYILACGALACR